MKFPISLIAAAALLAGCGLFDNEKEETPTVGQRIPVLSSAEKLEVDPALAAVPVNIPPPEANSSWPQPGGGAANSPGHLYLGQEIGQAWAASIGEGASKRARLAAGPVVADGKVFTIDTQARVRAFDAASGAMLWETQVGSEGENERALFGGGVAHADGRIFATNGVGHVAALDAATGGQYWKVRPGGPLRGAPTIANNNVYVISQDNQLFALDPANGETRWNGLGALEITGVFGSASPAAAQGTVVAGFSSGELTAYRYENGRTVWQEVLSPTSISTSVASLSDIDADPVIDAGRVYAIGQGGRMVALELISGQRLWELNIAGISTPAVAGDWLFVVTDEAKLLAIARETGRIRWVTQLPRYRDEEDKKGPLSWVGPVLAGNRLVLANSRGALTAVSPFDGSIISTTELGENVSLQPVIAGGHLYILTDSGRLLAWR
ncbi:MAG: PQQ-binding-like beta-propeller repeat protein [Sphingomonadaceae bacterium]